MPRFVAASISMIFRPAIQRGGKNARDRRLANAPMSAEDIAVRRAPLLDGILQCARDVLLANDVRELLRTVFSGKYGVTHEGEKPIIRDERRLRMACIRRPQQNRTAPAIGLAKPSFTR